ncbi:hypothetical protein K3495_g188 [Podosphaera aphanis]|nr:hypothetical protein K3495_g188 [Podosphaera aphanis]
MDILQQTHDVDEPASKRQKLSSTTPVTAKNSREENCLYHLLDVIQKNTVKCASEDTQSLREAAVGIRHYANPTRMGFSGILKKRYTDFIVNEIALDGTVHYLTDDRAAQDDNFDTNSKKGESSNYLDIRHSGNPGNPNTPTTATANANQNCSSPHLEPEVKLTNSGVGLDTPPSITLKDEAELSNLFGEEKKNEIILLYKKILSKPNGKSKEFGYVMTSPMLDRQIRGQVHQTLRRIFQSRFESSFDEVTKGIRISAATKTTRQGPSDKNVNRNREKSLKGKVGWNERGGEFLHMCLFKQDRDTMEVISHLARTLKVKPNVFSYAGTKDRRAVTTQRVSAYRTTAETMAKINGNIYNATVGNFKYEKQPLELGDLKGNLFTITLRECQFPVEKLQDSTERCQEAQKIVDTACKALASSGFINYFGLQRFGTFQIGTHTIGKLILQTDFAQAVASILMCSSDAWDLAAKGLEACTPEFQVGKDEIARAQAIRGFGLGEMKLEEALSILPRRFNAERNILNHLKTRKGCDFLGALISVPRNLRLMYVHAYQSFVWNEVASERLARYGNKVIAGDLVLVDVKKRANDEPAQFDECGEIIIQPAAHDVSIARDSIFERARAITSEEVACGKFNIFDIVLPLPGFDVEYPDNDIGQYYKIFMGSEQGGYLDPANMRRKQKDFSLSGGYRKLMAAVGHIEATTRIYYDENTQLVATDMDKLLERRAAEKIKSNAAAIDNCQSQGFNVPSEKLMRDNVATDTKDMVAPKQPEHTTFQPSECGEIKNDSSSSSSIQLMPQPASTTMDQAKIGVVLKFDLSLSQYATMLLRELMGADNVQHYQPDFGSRKAK